jgi:DNA modification methylase
MAVAELTPVANIVVHERQRKDYPLDEITKRAESIQRTKGLLHPIVIDPADNSLVAGGCRRMAYILLASRAEKDRSAGKFVPEDNWTLIPFVSKDQDDELFRKICELEENIGRLDLQWWERANAIAEIDEIQRKLAEGRGEIWNMRKTAEMLDVGLGTVSQAKQLVEAAKTDPTIKKEDTIGGALRKVETKKKLEERQREINRKAEGRITTLPAEILVGDAIELIKQQPEAEFDCIATNFPFGVEYGYSGKADKVYEDEEGMIVDLCREVVHQSYRVLKNDSWMLAFFDIRKATYSNVAYEFVREVLPLIGQMKDERHKKHLIELAHKSLGLAHWFEEAGFKYVRLMPIIWVKPNKTQGNIGDPRKGLVVAYEAAILACKGDGVLLKQGRQDILIYETLSTNERDFAMQMPVGLCKEVISWMTLGKGRVLDPFAGVGSFGEGALDNQCSFLGFELNPERAKIGNLRLREHIFAAEKKEV